MSVYVCLPLDRTNEETSFTLRTYQTIYSDTCVLMYYTIVSLLQADWVLCPRWPERKQLLQLQSVRVHSTRQRSTHPVLCWQYNCEKRTSSAERTNKYVSWFHGVVHCDCIYTYSKYIYNGEHCPCTVEHCFSAQFNNLGNATST